MWKMCWAWFLKSFAWESRDFKVERKLFVLLFYILDKKGWGKKEEVVKRKKLHLCRKASEIYPKNRRTNRPNPSMYSWLPFAA